MNCYHIVRIEKGVRGVPGNTLPYDHEGRTRHYVRAESQTEAMTTMSARFPGETFNTVKIDNDVAPLAWEQTPEVEAKGRKKAA